LVSFGGEELELEPVERVIVQVEDGERLQFTASKIAVLATTVTVGDDTFDVELKVMFRLGR